MGFGRPTNSLDLSHEIRQLPTKTTRFSSAVISCSNLPEKTCCCCTYPVKPKRPKSVFTMKVASESLLAPLYGWMTSQKRQEPIHEGSEVSRLAQGCSMINPKYGGIPIAGCFIIGISENHMDDLGIPMDTCYGLELETSI